jgi:hypothetical protein
LAFDLEWESVQNAVFKNPSAHLSSVRYDAPCEVNGILQLGDNEWTIAATGWRHHEWGILDWSTVDPYRRANEFGAGNTRFVAEAPILVELPMNEAKRLLLTLEEDTGSEGQTLGWVESFQERSRT